jgi:RNA ligase
MKYTLDDFIYLSNHKKEIRHKVEKVNDKDVHIFHYMIATPDLFKEEIERECRGITFNDFGECICRPFHKFFNIGEREETLLKNIQWDKVTHVLNKIDGSLLCPVDINGQIFWKTKKSFYSDIAIKIQNEWNKRQEFWYKYGKFIWDRGSLGCTMMFEYISPDNRIVIDYKTEELVYLCQRDIESGKYFDFAQITYNYMNINQTIKNKIDYENIINIIKQEKEKEGYVFYTSDNQIYKCKTQWYLDRHHLLSSLSYKEIFKMIAEERIDDVVSELRLNRYDKQVKIIEFLIHEYSVLIEHEHIVVNELYNEIMFRLSGEEGKEISRKDFAERVSKTFYAGILFSIYDNKEDQVEKMIQKNVLTFLIETYKNKVLFMGDEQ